MATMIVMMMAMGVMMMAMGVIMLVVVVIMLAMIVIMLVVLIVAPSFVDSFCHCLVHNCFVKHVHVLHA